MYTTGMQLQSHTLTAHNDAAASANKIHDDTVARQYGFRGGLVPGVSVYAYMTYPLVDSFGEAWLTRGAVQVQFAKPIYEGDRVTVTGTVKAVAESEVRFDLASTNAEGVVCGVSTAALPTARGTAPDPTEIPIGPRQAPQVPISWDAVVVGQPLPPLPLTVTQQDNEEYCHTHADDLVLYRGTRGFVHPGILLRQCNRIFSEHFILGPWIHVASDITTYRPCQVGETLEIRGVPVQKFEKKGHEFVVLDVLIHTAGEAVQRVKHTCIFRPRQSQRTVG
jgi:acyl dehydratase